MPPSLPAPSTASFLSESLRDMLNGLDNRQAVDSLFPRLAASSIKWSGIARSGHDSGKSESHLHSGIGGTAKRREAEHFSVMFVRDIIDPAKDRHVPVDLIFGCDIHEAVVFDVKVWS